MRILAWSLVVLACFPAAAQAQPVHTRGSAAGIAGGGRTWDDEGGLGSGAVVGGRIEWRLFSRTGVELSLDALSHDRSGGFFEAEGRTLFTGASLVQRFGSAAAQPYILGGLHLAAHSGSTTFGGIRTDRDSTDFGYHIGGGVAVRIGARMELGPEARFYMIQPGNGSDPALAYWIGARFGIRF